MIKPIGPAVRALHRAGRVLPLIAGLAAAAALAGCADALDKVNLFKSTAKDESTVPDRPAGELYNQGLGELKAGKSRTAIDTFKEVDRQHPYTEEARKAQIMLAFAAYQAGSYDDAVQAAKRFLALYPGSPDAAYARYIIGQAYFEQIPDVTRDQEATKQALAAMQEIIDNYPKSEYAADARKKIVIAKDQLAGKEMQVGRYYLERREYIAAINRFKVVVTSYATTRHIEEALERLTECYLAIGVNKEAQTAAAVLGHNFPDSPWYKDAFQLLQSGGLKPNEDKASWISKALKLVKT